MPVRQQPISATLSPKLKAAFTRSLTLSRWNTYVIAAGHDEDKALRLYLWNAAMGQSFHFPLQVVEIALRNVLNDALIIIFGPDWWQNGPCRTHLGPKRIDEIDKAETRLINKYGGTPNRDQLVASLMFGFWAALTHPKVTRLWPARRFAAFPNLPAAKSIDDISATVDRVQDLRNRIFHHEPLIGRDVLSDYADITDLLGWICPQTAVWMRKNASVPALIREKP